MSNYRYRSAVQDSPEQTGDTLTQRVYCYCERRSCSPAATGRSACTAEVAKRLGVSTVPVAEALLRLEMEGLVQSAPLWQPSRPLTLEDVEQGTVLREALECQAAARLRGKSQRLRADSLKAQARRLDVLMAEGDPHSETGPYGPPGISPRIAPGFRLHSLVDELKRIWFRRLMWMNWIKHTATSRVPRNWHEQFGGRALSTRGSGSGRSQNARACSLRQRGRPGSSVLFPGAQHKR